MSRIKSLNWYQKTILLLLAAMALVFTVLYPVTIHRKGFAYHTVILVPSRENGCTVYSGRIHGKAARFTVSPESSVEFVYDGKTYGPYTVTEDPAAVPKGQTSAHMTGISLWDGEKLLFRGGVQKQDGICTLCSADGSFEKPDFSFSYTSQGLTFHDNNKPEDPMAPTASDIIRLMAGPIMTSKGNWLVWFGGMLLCVLTAVSILFADELFRFGLRLQIRDAEDAEPSAWELIVRYVSWTLLPILAGNLFIMGLQ